MVLLLQPTSLTLTNLIKMKLLLPLLAALFLAGCTDSGPQPAYYTGPNLPYAASQTTGGAVYLGRNNAFSKWSTAQLQERRKDLYNLIPRRGLPNGDVGYVVRGSPLPQQDELSLVQGELDRRYQAGDRSAKTEPFWPESRRRPN